MIKVVATKKKRDSPKSDNTKRHTETKKSKEVSPIHKYQTTVVVGVVILVILGFVFVFLRSGDCGNIYLEKCGDACVRKGICTNKFLFSPNENLCIDGAIFKATSDGSRLALVTKCDGFGCEDTSCNPAPSQACDVNCDTVSTQCNRAECVRGKCVPIAYDSEIDRNGDCVDDCTGNLIPACETKQNDFDGDGIPEFYDVCPEHYSVFENGCDIQDILLNGMMTRKDMLVKEGDMAAETFDKGVTLLASSGPLPKYDYIKMKYFYVGVGCEEMLEDLDSKFGDRITLESAQDVLDMSVEEKEFIYTNWANHALDENLAGYVLKFPFSVFYGPGGKYDGDVLVESFDELHDYGQEHEKIQGVAPGFVTVVAEDKTCCEECLTYNVCNVLKDAPSDLCDEYLAKVDVTVRDDVNLVHDRNTHYDVPHIDEP